MSPVDPEVRALLVCPRCRGELRDAREGLVCVACERLYPVVDGVPWMLPERARRWRPTPEERESLQQE